MERLGCSVGVAWVRLSNLLAACCCLLTQSSLSALTCTSNIFFPRLAGSITHATRATGLPLPCFSSPCIILIFRGRLFWGPKHRAEISSGFLQPALVPSSSTSTDSLFKLGIFASTNWWKYLGEVKQLCNNQGCSETQWSTSQLFLLGSVSAAPSVPRQKHRFPSLGFYYSVGILPGATHREDALLG